MNKTPILITGIHRSGSTWIGNTIGYSSNVKYIHEPFNLQIIRANPLSKIGIYTLKSPVKYWFEYLDDSTQEHRKSEMITYIKRFYDLSSQSIIHEFFKIRNLKDIAIFKAEINSRKKRPLIKDPLALMASEFIAKEINAKVVISIRHPLAFIASLIRKNWRFDFLEFSKQDVFIKTHLAPFQEQISVYSKDRTNIVDEGILLWNIVHYFISKLKERHQHEWYFITHEQLSYDPMNEFKNLFDYLELDFENEVENQIHKSTSGEIHNVLNRNSKENIKSWKQVLTEEQIATIKKGTIDVAELFYDETSWI